MPSAGFTPGPQFDGIQAERQMRAEGIHHMLDAFFMGARFEEAPKNSQNVLNKWVRQAG